MPAPTHTRSHRPAADGVEIRLPWWAVALPAVVFAALLLMILSPDRPRPPPPTPRSDS